MLAKGDYELNSELIIISIRNKNIKMIIKTYIPSWWKEGCNELSNNDPIMKTLINRFNENKLSSIRNPFYSLCKSIVGQQISVAAASAVWNRLENKYNIFDGQFFKSSDLNQLKKIGLSERKASYLINLSEKLKDYNSYDYWNNLNDQEIYSFLIDIKGIGPWSIKMFMIFCLNRPDIFSADDIGLLKAIGKNYFKNVRPTKDEAENFSHRWKPWRTAASWYLWRSIDPEVVLY